jgi:hypothetical protein
MTETETPTRFKVESEVARFFKALEKLEKMDADDLVEARNQLAAIRGRLAYLEEAMPERAQRVYTMRGPDNCEEEVTLEVKAGRAVYFDTGAGVIAAYIAGGRLVVGIDGREGFPITARSVNQGEIEVSAEGWYPLEMGAHAMAVSETPTTTEPETFEQMLERSARYTAGLRQEADKVDAFMAELRADFDEHERAEANA